MNREIKFRNWYKPMNDMTPPKMIYLTHCQTVDSGCTLLFTDKERNWIDESDFETPILMQYTGLKDKNGKEIYESDIIEYTQHHFNTEMVKVKRKEVKWKYDKWGIYETNAGESEIEVIGNIYENPELLKQYE